MSGTFLEREETVLIHGYHSGKDTRYTRLGFILAPSSAELKDVPKQNSVPCLLFTRFEKGVSLSLQICRKKRERLYRYFI